MKNFLKTLSIVALTTAAFVQAGELTFETVDADKDGFISMTEAEGHAALLEQFKALDADADGQLSKEEFAKYGE
ncbi:hypothetical protein [Acanthopleuribacter pedis]|uniref:EF-hand domain-containing protein n=1 Tax=Acanthopleuribacter pedis TaxID=442870 RepID=A0A8J7U4N7_9BACT|nr:hypothetical protein [Acanthopleuribacter pedis]MBO1319633.1 hypothetical protein [Acanthopleuribacter pedis]